MRSCNIYGKSRDLIPYMVKVVCFCTIYGKSHVILYHIWEKSFDAIELC